MAYNLLNINGSSPAGLVMKIQLSALTAALTAKYPTMVPKITPAIEVNPLSSTLFTFEGSCVDGTAYFNVTRSFNLTKEDLPELGNAQIKVLLEVQFSALICLQENGTQRRTVFIVDNYPCDPYAELNTDNPVVILDGTEVVSTLTDKVISFTKAHYENLIQTALEDGLHPNSVPDCLAHQLLTNHLQSDNDDLISSIIKQALSNPSTPKKSLTGWPATGEIDLEKILAATASRSYQEFVDAHYPEMTEEYAFAIKNIIDLGLCNTDELLPHEFRSILNSLAEIKEYIGEQDHPKDQWQFANIVFEALKNKSIGTTEIALAMSVLLNHFIIDLQQGWGL